METEEYEGYESGDGLLDEDYPYVDEPEDADVMYGGQKKGKKDPRNKKK